MNFRDLWEGRTGRLPYLAVLIVSSAAIAILLFIAGKMAPAAHAPGVDPELSTLRVLLIMLLLGIGFLIAGVPLVLFARRRMRELGLSGVWLLLFPIAPLQALFTFAATSTWYFIWPLTITSPATTPLFWLEFAFGVFLAVLPSGNHLERSPARIARFAHFATTCDGRLNRQAFALRLAIVVGLTVLQAAVTLGSISLGSIGGLPRHGEHSVSILAVMATLANGLLTVLVVMFVTSTTIRRLHDLNLQGWWIVFFPLGLPSLAPALPIVLINPQTILRPDPFILFSTVEGLGCLMLLVWLLLKRGSDFNNSYDLPIDRGNGGYVPA
jgi:uncharacterized membrane protein YhaH (DUF805 family)